MATTKIAVDARIDIDLKSLQKDLDDLPELAAEWAELDETDRLFWIREWDDNITGLFRYLTAAYADGRMIETQAEQYRIVCTRLVAALPTFHTMGLYGFDAVVLAANR